MKSDVSFRETAYQAIRAVPEYPAMDVLELGCGDGFILERVTRDGARARGTTYRKDDDD